MRNTADGKLTKRIIFCSEIGGSQQERFTIECDYYARKDYWTKTTMAKNETKTIKRSLAFGSNPSCQKYHKKQQGVSLLSSIARRIANIGAKNLFNRGTDIGSKAISSEIGKKVIGEGFKHGPELYRLGTPKIKNKSLRNALDSDVANYIVNETHKRGEEIFENLFGGI